MLLKLFTLCVVLCLGVQQTNARIPPEVVALIPPNMYDLMMTLRGICSNKFGLTSDYIEHFTAIDEATEPVKCYMECMLSAAGWMDVDGKINFDKMLAMSPPKLRRVLEGLLNKCRDIPDGERCETAFKFNLCMFKVDPKLYFLA